MSTGLFSIGDDGSLIDVSEVAFPKEDMLQELVANDLPTGVQWITNEELADKPELVKTMSVHPPTGMGKVRLVAVEGIDLQPCGGTHVAHTGEIGRLRVGKIENKGRHNRRINVHLDD